jgi:hypothetical protein
MPSFVLQQVSSKFARSNAAATLEKPINLKYISKYLDETLFARLNSIAYKGLIHIWGAKYERYHQFQKMCACESLVFFRREKRIFAYGVIAEITINEALADSIWGRDNNNETWPLIFFLRRLVFRNSSAAEFNRIIGRKPNDNWQALFALALPESPAFTALLSETLYGD